MAGVVRWCATVVVSAVLVAACAQDGGDERGAAPAAGAGGSQAGSEAALVAQGAQLYESMTCVGCHGPDATGGVGPGFHGLWGSQRELDDGSTVTADAAYIEESIREPQAKIVAGARGRMVGFDPSPQEMDALLAYIRSLR